MLRCGQKRRRTKAEITEEKEEADLKQQAIEEKLEKYDALMQAHNEAKQQAQSNQAASDILKDLASKKKIHISKEGDVLVPGIDEIPDEEFEDL